MIKDLLAAALAARANAHVPYSHFQVGAALRTASGRIVAGCNVENAAYPQGQCAEATAIGAMVTAGEREIAEILVVGEGESLCSPCGGCRQRLAEFAGPETPVHLCGPEGVRLTTTLADLLPLAFSGRDLNLRGSGNEAGSGSFRDKVAALGPRIAILLGSGLGALADAVQEPAAFPYVDLPGFPRPSIPGHAGRAVLGRIGETPVLVLQGRAHLYEGADPRTVFHWVRALQRLGIESLLLTNAAGSLRAEIGAGSLVLIEDHINFQGPSPLLGLATADLEDRFIDLSEVYDAGLRQGLAAAAQAAGIALPRGVYLALLGPAFETPAEIRAFRTLGADLIGMSTVPEAIAARALGLRVAGISVVTNLAAGMGAEPLSHAQTLAATKLAAGDLARLVHTALPELVHVAA